MKIEKIKLYNFRRFTEAEIELNPNLNIFVGSNNSGKTTILEALGLIFGYGDKLGSHQLNKSMETGTCFVEVNLKFDSDEWKKSFLIVRHEFEDHEDIKKAESKEFLDSLSKIPLKGKWESSFSDGRRTRQTRIFWMEKENLEKIDIYNPIINRALSRLSGHNVIALFNSTTYLTAERRAQLPLEGIVYFNNLINRMDDVKYVRNRLFFLKKESPRQFEDLREKVCNLFNFDDFDVEPNFYTGKVDLTITLEGKKFDIAEMGSGTKSFLLLFSHIYLSGIDIALIDESDENLHTSLVEKLAHFMKKASKNVQFVVTSHNQTFIKQFELNDLYRVEYLEEKKSSEVKKLDIPTDFDSLLELLGFRLSPYQKAESRFAKILVFIEGDSDEKYLKKFAEKIARLEELNAMRPNFYPLGGKWNLHKYVNPSFIEKITERKTPILLVLDRDEDYQEDISEIEEKIGKERLHYLQKREIENYLIQPKIILKCLKKKSTTLTLEIKKAINELTEEKLEDKLKEFSEELKPKIVLIRLLKQLLPYRFFYPKEMGEFIRRNRGKEKEEIVRDLSAQLFDKITKLTPNDLKELLENEEGTLDKKWSDETRFNLCPGKDLLSAMNKWLQNDFNVNISGEEIIDELEEVDDDIVELLDKMKQLVNG